MTSLLERVALLKGVDIFAHTPDEMLSAVAAIVTEIEYQPGETFIKQGDYGESMYLIVDGAVLIHQGEREIFTLGPGKSVGELAILDLAPREASVTTVEPSRLFRIDKDAFDEVLDDSPEIAQSVIRALCQRVRMTTAALSSN